MVAENRSASQEGAMASITTQQTWIVTSANMNLRIVGNIGPLPMAPGGSVLGFGVFAGPSFMQVARRNGRYFLRDGYHRALWLAQSPHTNLTLPGITLPGKVSGMLQFSPCGALRRTAGTTTLGLRAHRRFLGFTTSGSMLI